MKFWTWLKSLFVSKPTTPAIPPVPLEPEKPVEPVPELPMGNGPLPWILIAEKEVGTKEVIGKGSNPRVLEYHDATVLDASSDDVPWCAAFVSWVFQKSNLKSQRTAWARDWLKWGVKLETPIPGCVVIFSRGDGGHVAFYRSGFKTGTIKCLGGNQANAVNVANYRESNVLGYRWPSDYPLPISLSPNL